MVFKKGNVPWNMGVRTGPLSEETRKKLSKSLKRVESKNRYKKGQSGKAAGHWKGGRIVDNRGYVFIYCPDHPYAIHGKYVLEHRLVMEAHIGRVLLPTEIVHHIDGDHGNNIIENLTLYSSHSDHMKDHHPKGRKIGRKR